MLTPGGLNQQKSTGSRTDKGGRGGGGEREKREEEESSKGSNVGEGPSCCFCCKEEVEVRMDGSDGGFLETWQKAGRLGRQPIHPSSTPQVAPSNPASQPASAVLLTGRRALGHSQTALLLPSPDWCTAASEHCPPLLLQPLLAVRIWLASHSGGDDPTGRRFEHPLLLPRPASPRAKSTTVPTRYGAQPSGNERRQQTMPDGISGLDPSHLCRSVLSISVTDQTNHLLRPSLMLGVSSSPPSVRAHLSVPPIPRPGTGSRPDPFPPSSQPSDRADASPKTTAWPHLSGRGCGRRLLQAGRPHPSIPHPSRIHPPKQVARRDSDIRHQTRGHIKQALEPPPPGPTRHGRFLELNELSIS